MFENLVGRKCKIVMESLGSLMDGYNAPVIFGAEILEAGESFIKIITLDKVKAKRFPGLIEYPNYFDEGEETYLNLKNIVSITPL
ncbi:MAG: hypothetical protein IKQ31_03155 [Clostridia bacterium]|nr:hypothetical protein [Clostridia bacterium]